MTRRPFVVNVAPLLGARGECQRARRSGVIADLSVCASVVPEGAEVDVEVVLEPAHPGVLVSGVVSAPWAGECRRCLGDVAGCLRVEVRELYEPAGDPDTTYRLVGEQVDLEAMARDAILLELPLAPLCRSGCRGLCPTCGADRNRSECRCEPSDLAD